MEMGKDNLEQEGQMNIASYGNLSLYLDNYARKAEAPDPAAELANRGTSRSSLRSGRRRTDQDHSDFQKLFQLALAQQLSDGVSRSDH
ncbi:MAG: hypothetical protein HQL58_04625 [Magnetococcales bacterium]|nr:hypothetical protein [Magnetococcales bacterium]